MPIERGRRARPAPPVHRPPDPAEPRRPDRQLHDAPRRGRARRVVRLGLDVVRPGALPVRERRVVRAPLPGRLHRRVHRADPRLVLHAARAGDRAVRPAGVLVVRQPRHRARQRRPEDEQVAEELPRRVRGVQPRRRRRDALVPHVERHPARQQPRSSPRRASARACARCSSRCGTAGTSSASTRTPPTAARGTPPSASTASTDPLDRYLLAKLRRPGRDGAGPDGRLRHPWRLRVGAPVRRRDDQLVHPPLAGTVLGHRAGDAAAAEAAFDTLYTALEVLTRVAAPLLPLVTEEIWRGLTGGRSVHLEDWPDAADLPRRRRDSSPRWTRCAPCAPPAPRLRKAEKLRVRLPLPRLTVVTNDPEGLRPFAGIVADELNVKDVTVLDVAEAHGSDFGISQRLVVNARAAGPAAGPRRADRHPGQQDRRLVGGRRRHGHLGRARARRGRVRRRDGRRRRAGRART